MLWREVKKQKRKKRKMRKHGADTVFDGKRQLRNGCQATARAWQELAAILRKAQA
jgi:hypothetical protein